MSTNTMQPTGGILMPLGHVAEPTKESTRLTFEQAVQNVLDNSKLLALKSDPDNHESWAEAYNADMKAAQDFFNKFAADLSRITGRRVTPPQFSLKDTVSMSYKDLEARVNNLANSFESNFCRSVEQMTQRLQNCYDKSDDNKFFPCSKVRWEGDICTFQYVDVNVVHQVKFARPAKKHPDDFTRRIPKSARRKLSILQTTHFDYQPKILDGLLVDTAIIKKHRPVSEALEEIAQDPALLLCCGKHGDYAVEYWPEPWPGLVSRSTHWFWNSWCAPMAICYAILTTGICMTMTQDGVPWWVGLGLAIAGGIVSMIATLVAANYRFSAWKLE